jgi:Phasin protein
MEATPQVAAPKRLTSAPHVDIAQMPGLDVWQSAISTMTAWNSRALSSVSSLNKGWLDFINHRIEADADHCKRLSACKSPDEWWRLVSSFVEVASHDYQDHLARVAKISSEVAAVSAGDLIPQARRNPPNGGKSGSRNH